MPTRYFVIGQDGRPHGPLTAEEIAGRLRDGFANRHSRARRESESEWYPLHAIEELRDLLLPPPRLETPRPQDRDAPDTNRRTVNIRSSFTRAWTLVTRNFIELAGWSLSTGLLLFLVSQVPRVGWFIALVGYSVLNGGLSVVYLARIRGRGVELKDVFAAVSATAVNLSLVGLTQIVLTIAGGLLLIAPGLYLAVAYIFAVTLAIDKRLHFWTALELSRRVITRQWWPTFGLILASMALFLGGVLTYGVGLVLAVPLSTAALMYAYEDVFGD